MVQCIMKICTKCGGKKDTEQFQLVNKTTGRRRADCLECHNAVKREHYRNNPERYRQSVKDKRIKNREYVKSILLKTKCMDCSNDDWRVLEFDHVRGTKVTNVSTMIDQMYSLKKIQDEIEKCDIVCRNCHVIRTHVSQDSYRNN
jgi:hypothetical protein